MGHQAGQGYCLQSLDPTSMSEGLIFLPVHMASRDSQHFVISHPTAIIFFFKHQNTLRYIHMQWPHFWVKERQRLGYPGLAFSWSTFCTVVPFLSSSLFYLLWFPSGLLLCPLIFFILMPECLSLSLKAVVSNKPSLVFFFFFKLFSYFKFPLPQSSVWISAFHLGHLIPCFWNEDKRRFLLLLFSLEVMPNSLQPHELQHARLPCPSLSLRVCSDLCPLGQWCHLTTSFSAAPFFFCL